MPKPNNNFGHHDLDVLYTHIENEDQKQTMTYSNI